NMLVAARETHVQRLVYAASSAAYGDHAALPRVEAHVGRPLSPYGASKYMDELYAQAFASCYGTSAIGLRYFNVFGPRQDPDGAYAAVIPKWIAAMLRGEPVDIYGDGETSRDFCFIENVVQANVRAGTVSEPAAQNEVYNVALGEQTSLNELFAILQDLLRQRIAEYAPMQAQYKDFRPGDVRFSRADISKAQRLLGFAPTCRVREGLERALDWYIARLAPDKRTVTQRIAAVVPTARGVPEEVSLAADRMGHSVRSC
ncbi:MAG: NAD-dependent epimerase/dehydratase family protein, partial [Bacillota bacterium]